MAPCDSKPPEIAPVTVRRRRAPVALDESVRFSGFDAIRDGMPPTLYVDDYTILREVSDVRKLRAGDHCIVGLNVFHKLWQWGDALNALLSSWQALPLPWYHHFIVVDDVHGLDDLGQPVCEDGRPVHIAEFSDTFANAWLRFVADGYFPSNLLRNLVSIVRSPARLHTPPLVDYLGLRGRGVFVVVEARSEAQRKRTVETALAMARGGARAQPTYGLISANCEHLANSLCGRSKVSPQVPHNLWNLFRIGLQLVGVVALYVCSVTPSDHEQTRTVAAICYHLFSTIPVAAQAQIGLVRAAVNLTQRRADGDLDHQSFRFLISKEVIRNAVVMILAVGGLSVLPRLVSPPRVRIVCALSLLALQLASVVFNVVANAIYRILLLTGVGVPVARFDDLRVETMRRPSREDLGMASSSASTPPAPPRGVAMPLSSGEPRGRANRSPVRHRRRNVGVAHRPEPS